MRRYLTGCGGDIAGCGVDNKGTGCVIQVLSRVRRCKSGCGEVKQDTSLKEGFGVAKKGVARCCIEGSGVCKGGATPLSRGAVLFSND
jgi:hypothetical protein